MIVWKDGHWATYEGPEEEEEETPGLLETIKAIEEAKSRITSDDEEQPKRQQECDCKIETLMREGCCCGGV